MTDVDPFYIKTVSAPDSKSQEHYNATSVVRPSLTFHISSSQKPTFSTSPLATTDRIWRMIGNRYPTSSTKCCVFRADPSTKMATLASVSLRQFQKGR